MRELLRVFSAKGALGKIYQERAVLMTDDHEEPVYERFRLSRMEFFVIQRIYNQLEIGMVLSPRIQREWEEAWQNDDYPFRNDENDEAPVIGAIVQEMPI